MRMVLGWDYSQVCKYILKRAALDLAFLCYDHDSCGTGVGQTSACGSVSHISRKREVY